MTTTPTDKVTLRKATVDDIPVIHRLAWQVFPLTYQDILSKEQSDYMMEWMYSPDNLRKQMTEEGHTYLLALADGDPVGYVSVQQEEPHVWHLQKIYVLPHCQGLHVGETLFHGAIAEIKRQHPEPCEMRLNVNRHNKALGFYQHMGMRKIAEGDFDIGDGYYMNDYIMGMEI